MNLNYIDFVIIILIGIFALKGFHLGFIRSLFNLGKYLISIFICKMWYKALIDYIIQNESIYTPLSKFINNILINIMKNDALTKVATKTLIQVMIILIIFIVSNLVLEIAINLIDDIFKFAPLNILNKSMGFLFGALKGFLILLIILTLVHPFLIIFEKHQLIIDLNNSFLLKYLYMYNFLFKYFNDFIEIFNNYKVWSML
ncbi:MAG: CvpA family protein [Tepidibacter sp.]|jgi:membrane protein required for colicin V production|uniref:CvpA family protein n=1 Tax=Tepidibacter sp. TaxID=2529387 RepID=UPI0025D20038|nr:CvpA family protein [Tepidibacter sp.]MCT4507248.1 CvpA family protein [Tepidibacter sp.]